MTDDKTPFIKSDLLQRQKVIIDEILSIACGEFKDYKDYIDYVDNYNYIAKCQTQERMEKNPMNFIYVPCKRALSKPIFDYIIQYVKAREHK